MASLTSGQARFASVFANETGLDPHVVGAWLLAEQNGSAAQFYQRKNYNNWLNIARTDSGDKGGAHSSIWNNPDSAAKASAEWMRGQGPIAHSYGKPASGITAILGSHGQAPTRQVQAIARSGWASSGYNGGSTLLSLLGQTGNIHAEAGQARTAAATTPTRETVKETSTLDKGALEHAQQQAAGARAVASLFTGDKPGDVLLRQALEKAGQEPNEQQYVSKSVVKTPTGTYHVPSAESGSYVNPFPHGTRLERTDMGKDAEGANIVGKPIRAIGDSKLVHIDPSWFQGQPYYEFELVSGPRKGQKWYASEQVRSPYKVGDYIRAGHAIGYVAPQGTGLELGFGAGGGRTKAQATTGYHEGQVTPAGQEFANFIKGLR